MIKIKIKYVMITFDQIPVWGPDQAKCRYYRTYSSVIANFERCCGTRDVFFLDSTYLDGPAIVDRVGNHEKTIIFNLVDAPLTWQYVRTLLKGKHHIMVGTEAPDIPTHFWLAWSHVEFPLYTDQDLVFIETPAIFLNYNYRMSEHRVNLIRHMNNQNLQNHGIITTGNVQGNLKLLDSTITATLGDMDIWRGHFLNIVSDTLFRPNNHPEIIMSEKILKPLLGLRPFIVNGSPRYYDILESWGIDFFADLWPISDMRLPANSLQELMDRNHTIICDVIKSLEKENLSLLYQKLLPRLQANRQRTKQLAQAEYQRLCVDDIELSW